MRNLSARQYHLTFGVPTPDGRRWQWAGSVEARTKRGAPMVLERWTGECPRCHGPHEITRKAPRARQFGYHFTKSVCDSCRFSDLV